MPGCADFLNCILQPLQYGFILRGLVAALLIGVIGAVIGAFVVTRDLSFIGDALAHAAFPGVVIAFLLGINIALGGTVFGIITALAIGFVTRRSQVSLDTAIGVLFAGAFALGVVLLSTIKTYTKELFGLLLGNVLAISSRDLLTIGIMGLLVLGIIALLYKELVLHTFDPTLTEVLGFPTGLLHYLLLSLLAVTVVISIQTVGIVLVVAMLVTPAATASLVVRRFPMMMLWGAAQGIIAALAGFYISYYYNVASGASIVLVHTAIFVIVLLLSPRPGALGALFRRRQR